MVQAQSNAHGRGSGRRHAACAVGQIVKSLIFRGAASGEPLAAAGLRRQSRRRKRRSPATWARSCSGRMPSMSGEVTGFCYRRAYRRSGHTTPLTDLHGRGSAALSGRLGRRPARRPPCFRVDPAQAASSHERPSSSPSDEVASARPAPRRSSRQRDRHAPPPLVPTGIRQPFSAYSHGVEVRGGGPPCCSPRASSAVAQDDQRPR